MMDNQFQNKKHPKHVSFIELTAKNGALFEVEKPRVV